MVNDIDLVGILFDCILDQVEQSIDGTIPAEILETQGFSTFHINNLSDAMLLNSDENRLSVFRNTEAIPIKTIGVFGNIQRGPLLSMYPQILGSLILFF